MTGSDHGLATPEATVIVPTHRRAALLTRLLDSLSKQTLDPTRFEVLIVHNHTEDGTEALAQAWCATQLFHARYFRQNFNGPTRSRAFAAGIARGRVLAFIDDDCVATPDWLAAGLSAIDRGFALVQGRTLPVPQADVGFPNKTVTVDGPTPFFETCNIFYERAAFESVGGFSPDFLDRFYGEDTDLGWKVVERGLRTGFEPQALVHHEVFAVTVQQWLMEPNHFVNIPYVVRKHPRLREHLCLRWFASRDLMLFNLVLLGLVVAAAGATVVGMLLMLPYVIDRYRSGTHAGRPLRRVLRVIAGILRHAVAWWALVRGSWRARTLLL